MIGSFIFFDLETTGFIEKNCMPKITEMSLIAVSVNSIRSGVDSLPRVLHKLTLPINPDRSISTIIEIKTGLSNENLRNARSFNCEIYTLITNFIKQLKAPVCFVAHNGNQFDYPIFLWELKNIDKVLSKDILSIDMLCLVRAFYAPENNPIMQTNKAQGINRTSCNTEIITIVIDDDYDELMSDALERTPKTQKISESQYRNTMSQNKQESCPKKKSNFTSDKPNDFKLCTIYKHFFHKYPENVHSAEGDCLSMIRCAIKLGDFFVDWAERNAVPLITHKH